MAIDKTRESINWFSDKIKTATGLRRSIVATHQRGRENTVIGKMYFFVYDPKWKDILPVYDKFPLVFPIERYPDGFLGLNLHYLNTNERSVFLNKLKDFRTNNRFDENTRLRLSYDLISSTRRLASSARPCIKRYLFGQVRSQFIEVVIGEWDQAIILPTENFVYKG